MKHVVRIAATLAAGALFHLATPCPAQATTLDWNINVNPTDMSATARVYDSFGGTFTATLTAAGAVTCGVVSPQTTITAFDQEVGNPAYLSTPGTCSPYNGEVTYDLMWIGVLGTSGHHTVVCIAHLGAVTCSLPGIRIVA